MKIKDEKLYYVGGIVRDEMLGVPSFDTDYCYEGDAIEFSKKFNVIKTNPDFGTVRILDSGKEIDIASTRTESYPKNGHLPCVSSLGCNLVEDLKRRDFTINAMAKNTLTNEIIDYFDGRDDIKHKKIRILHEKSFIEDPTRIVRGLKFSVRFGFELEPYTKKIQEVYLNNINYDMSYHRLKKELMETFNLNKNKAFEEFVEQGIYKLLGPNQTEPKVSCDIETIVCKYSPKHVWLVYVGLFNLSNFELNGEEKEIIEKFNNIKETIPKDDYSIYKLFNKVPLESILLYMVSVDFDTAQRYLDTLSEIIIETNGEDLKSLGIKQGPIYSDIFEYLLKEKIKNPNLLKINELDLVQKFINTSFK